MPEPNLILMNVSFQSSIQTARPNGPRSTPMLARNANNLFWMGRYLERGEHLSRYIKVQYYQVLDAPSEMSKEQAMESILYMVGGMEGFWEKQAELTDANVLSYCCFDRRNEFSIYNVASRVRDNARSARDLLSTEAWEAINRFYHRLGEFSLNEFFHERRYDFCQHVIESAYIVKGLLNNTLLHDATWSMINIGIHLERAIQTLQIIQAKLNDIKGIDPESAVRGLQQNYHWVNLLKSVGGFDMSRKTSKRIPGERNVLEFLVLNPNFPKSITHNLIQLKQHLEQVEEVEAMREGTALFEVGKLAARLTYTTVPEVLEDKEAYLNKLRDCLYLIGTRFDAQYLKF